VTEITCETQGHLWGATGACVMCKTPKPPEHLTSNPIDVHTHGPDGHWDYADIARLCALRDSQAQEIERLTRERDELRAGFGGEAYTELVHTERRLRVALEWYAKHMVASRSMDMRIITQDGGERAREALGEAPAVPQDGEHRK